MLKYLMLAAAFALMPASAQDLSHMPLDQRRLIESFLNAQPPIPPPHSCTLAGGDPEVCMAEAYFWAKHGGVRIDVDLTSASVVFIKAANCIGRNVTLYEHEARDEDRPGEYAFGVRDEKLTKKVRNFLPPCARPLFEHARAGSELEAVSGEAVSAACHIRLCD